MRGTCTNRLTIRRDEVERRVLSALQHKLLNRELFAEFCEEFTREMNRLRMEARAGLSATWHQLAGVQREIDTLIRAILDGVPGRDVKDQMQVLSDRKEQLTRELEEARSRNHFYTPAWLTSTARRS